jgi:hypothetical protein
MNKKVIFIFILALIAIVVLYLYSFGPLSGQRISHNVNPASLKPVQSEPVTVNNKPQIFNNYHNKDLQENFYTVKLPQEWQVQAGNAVGSYTLHYSDGYGAVELMDVPDNSTLELYVLSQEEPKLKNTLTEYKRADYTKTAVNNNEAYQLTYTSTANGQTFQTVRIYIAGQDHAGVITLSVSQKDYDNLKALFNSIIISFQWENK